MANIIGIPTTRVSDLFVRERLTNQVQLDQLEMFRAQMQLSTGRRFQMPSEDADAALRVMSLQRLLERKDQAQGNLVTNQSYLTATDTTMSTVSNNMAEVRGLALGVLGTTATDTQRAAAAQQINQMIFQLRDIGNHKFRGRFLFAGSGTTVRPFEATGDGLIQYFGDERRLSSYSDVDLLFDTNLQGNEVFGAISDPVRGSENLNPILTYDTRLADLRGGQGIVDGSVAISVHNVTGVSTSTIDFTSAETIGDVAEMIRANAPAGTTLDVEITATGLWLNLNGAPGDSLSIREVGGGTTADELGILAEAPTVSPIVGGDLNPILRLTTRVDDILGTRAGLVARSAGVDNDVIFETRAPGTTSNGINIVFVDDGTVVNRGVDEVATYDAATSTLTVTVRTNSTEARDVVAAVDRAFALDGTFPLTARIDPLDDVYGGQAEVDVAAFGATAGGAGKTFDKDSGLQIVNGGKTHTISFADADTIEDVLNTLNMSDAGVLAEINENATGIDIRSRVSGADFMIGENGGTTATELGVRTFTESTRLEDLNLGFGVVDFEGMGTAAAAVITSTGANNDVLIQARQAGVNFNDFTISVVDSGGPVGSETLAYDPVAKTMQFAIVPGSTTAGDLITLFQSTPGARDDFEISLDATTDVVNSGVGLVGFGSVTTSGGIGGGGDFTITRNDGVALDIDIAGVETIGQMLTLINTHPDNLVSGIPLVARLATVGNGIELVDDNPGDGTLTVTRSQLSTAAIALGLIPPGQGSNTTTTPGAQAAATLTSAATDSNLVFRSTSIGTPANGTQVIFQDTGMGPGSETFSYDAVLKTLTFGIDPGTTSANDMIGLLQADAIAGAAYSATLEPLDGSPNDGSGAVDVATVTLAGGTQDVLTGSDVNRLETKSVFTALLRLRQALEVNDPLEAQRAIDLLDTQTIAFNFSRAELGARQQGLDIMQDRLESEVIDLRDTLSMEFDAEMVEAISNFVGRQAAYEASLRATAQTLQLSLLNFL